MTRSFVVVEGRLRAPDFALVETGFDSSFFVFSGNRKSLVQNDRHQDISFLGKVCILVYILLLDMKLD